VSLLHISRQENTAERIKCRRQGATHGRVYKMITLADKSNQLDLSTAVRVVALNILLAGICVIAGEQYAYPAGLAPVLFRCSALIIFSSLLVLGAPFFHRNESPCSVTGNLLCALLCQFQLSITIFLFTPSKIAAILILAMLLGVWTALKLLGSRVAVHFCLLVGFTLFAVFIYLKPEGTQGADMLAFIARAIDIFVSGHDPYIGNYSKIDPNPFIYLPLQWLIFLPLRLLSIDLRLVNLASLAAMIALVEWRSRRHEWLRMAAYPILFSAVAFPLMYQGQVWPYWLAVLCGSLLAVDRRWFFAALAFATAISIRQTALIPAAIIFCGLFRCLRPVYLAAIVIGATSLIAAFNLPFVHTVADLQTLFVTGPAKAVFIAHLQGNPGTRISLSNIMDHYGYQTHDIQVGAMIALGFVLATLISQRSSVGGLLTLAGIGYVLAISANPYIHHYYYIAGFLIAAIGISSPVGVTIARDGSITNTQSR
jgi:hypothetical protein